MSPAGSRGPPTGCELGRRSWSPPSGEVDLPAVFTSAGGGEVGRRFHVTPERARQIQIEALRKLRRSPLAEHMRAYLA